VVNADRVSHSGRPSVSHATIASPGSARNFVRAARRYRTVQIRAGQRSQPTRSAITVAGIAGYACKSSLIRGSNASTAEPAGSRPYLGGASLAKAARTVFLEIPSVRTIALIGIFSARCSPRISAQSSTTSYAAWPAAFCRMNVVDQMHPTPLYAQLANILRAMIESGELVPRAPLPSESYLQQEYGVSRGTVRTAVGLLRDEGLVVTIGGRGTFVRPGSVQAGQ
jgi:GntR family transcriptional regulator/GntR family mannosyl-D-glycerate transport/metabolism transcriptional repressor